jgi:MerR family transcriptional regulator, light-induced transcriptional regulator
VLSWYPEIGVQIETSGMPKKPLTLLEAADKLGVHYMTVYRYVRTGRLPATRVGGSWQVDPNDLAQVKPAGARSSRDPATRASATKARLEARLLAGDEAGAWGLIEAALASDRSPAEVLLQLVAPALESIGDRWHDGELTVADEHLASAVAVRLISRIGARFGRRGPKRGSVVLTTPPAEQHSAPVAIAADLLRWAGFNVIELGADTPADALPGAVAGVSDLLAVAMACTTRDSTASARRTIAHLRAALPDTTVLLGGAAVTDADHALRLGADGFTGRRGDDLVRAVEDLADAR